MERLVEIDKSDTDALVDHAVAEGVKRGLLMAARMAEERARTNERIAAQKRYTAPAPIVHSYELVAWEFRDYAACLRAKAAE